MGGPGSGRRKQAETIQREVEAERARMAAAQTEPPSDDGSDARGDRQEPVAPTPPQRTMPPLIEVEQPTGTTLQVQGEPEKKHYEAAREHYEREFKFESAADRADLAALLFQELLLFRYQSQLGSGTGYDGWVLTLSQEEQLRKNVSDATRTIGALKSQMGVTRAARDSAQGSVADQWESLRKRAHAFGIHRNEQVLKAITLANELISIVGTYDRSNDLERRTVGFESESDIVEWVRTVFTPRFRAVDEEFKRTQQRWIEQGEQ